MSSENEARLSDVIRELQELQQDVGDVKVLMVNDHGARRPTYESLQNFYPQGALVQAKQSSHPNMYLEDNENGETCFVIND